MQLGFYYESLCGEETRKDNRLINQGQVISSVYLLT